MNRLTIIILVFGLIIGCNEIDYKPKYREFDNAWEQDNLIGKVKSIEQLKANVTDFENEKLENPLLELKKEYTEFGEVYSQQYFDNFGKLEMNINNEYDKKKKKIKSISENILKSLKSIEKYEYNDAGKPISISIIQNDTLIYNAKFKYNIDGYLTDQTEIQNQDTTTNTFSYVFNNDGKVISKKQIQNCEYGIYEYINTYKYENNNLLEALSKSKDFGSTKIVYSYDKKNRIKEITNYRNDKVSKQKSFDKFYNPILVRYFNEGKLNKEIKYTYDFDDVGNWIERRALMKEDVEKDKKWLFIFVQTRNIEYFE